MTPIGRSSPTDSTGVNLGGTIPDAPEPRATGPAALLELLPCPVFRLDRELRHTYANGAALRALGRPRESVLGRTVGEAGIPEPIASEIEERLRAVLATGGPAEHRALAPTPAGEVAFLTRFVPEFGPGGEVAAVVGIGTDITEQARVEAALRENERRYRLMIECVEEYALLQLAADGRVVSWNAGAERIKGYTEAEALGLPYASFFPPDARDRAAALLAEAAANGHTEDEGWRVRKDGSRFWASAALSAQFGPRGDLLGFTKITRDLTPRKRAEEALRASDERARAIVASAFDAIVTIAPDGTIVGWNRGAERVFGYTEAEARGADVELVIPAKYRGPHALALSAFDPARPSRMQGAVVELAGLRKGGEEFPLEIALTHSEGPNGRVFTAVIRDVTDRKRAEEALRANEAMLRQFIKHSPAAVAMFDTEMRYLQASDRWLADYGLADRDVIGRSHYELFPNLPERWLSVHKRVLAGSVERCAEDRFDRADGSTDWIEWECRPWHQPGGTVGGLIMFGQVITPRKRAEEALRASEERHRQMLADLTELVCRFRPDGTITYVNDVYARTFGKRPEELLGRAWQPVAYAADVAHIESRLAEMSPANPTVVIENRIYDADGAVRWMEFVNVGFYDAAGALTEVQAVGRDVTDRRAAEDARRKLEADLRANEERGKYERQMLQAQKLESLGVLAGGIAHDFNNLLTAILGYASLGRMRIAPSDPLAADLKQIELASQRAADLCAQMLAYAGRGQFVVAPIDLSVLVQEMAQLLATALSKKAVLKFNLADHLSPLVADPTQVRQVVMNLITNASDAIGQKSGVITLTTGEIDADERYLRDIDAAPDLSAGAYVYVEVSDTGCGMSEETKAKIFDPFFTTKFTGRGLGLAAVLGIVRAHKGAVKAYTQLGKGTTFKVLFPVAGEPRPVGPSGSRVGPALAPFGRGRRVLVVDDEEDVRVFARKALELAGFKVDVAVDGRDGADAFAATPHAFDLVLIDLTMPRLGGADAYREMRRARPDVRAILTSGFAMDEAISGFEGKGLAGFVRKPFRADELLKTIRDAVGP